MRDCNRAVKKVIPTAVATDDLDNDNAPDVTQISDDSSVDSLLFSHDSESEVGIWDNTNNNDVSFAPEGRNQNVIPLYNEGVWAPVVGHLLIVAMRELIHFQIAFLIQTLLLRELDINVVKQNIILQLFGNAVLMANLNPFSLSVD
jgi:hypothetical protein